MTARVFLDTNLWIFSTQVLGEIYHVLSRKTLYTKQECQATLQDLDRAFSPILSIDTATVLKALEINDRYSYSYWDSLILATALLNDCETLYSEDMQHNMIILDLLHISNPFTAN